jgi:2-iminobutanoate/2-iminopropanoate deaminase
MNNQCAYVCFMNSAFRRTSASNSTGFALMLAGRLRCWSAHRPRTLHQVALRTSRLFGAGRAPAYGESVRNRLRTLRCRSHANLAVPSLRAYRNTLFVPALVAEDGCLASVEEQLGSCLSQLDEWLRTYQDYEVATLRINVAPNHDTQLLQRLERAWAEKQLQSPAVTWLEARPLVPARDVLIEAVLGLREPAAEHSLQTVATEQAAQAVGPYVQAVRFPRAATLYVSGCIGLRPPPANDLAGPDVESQTKQALANMKAILRAGGSDVVNILKVMILLEDLSDFAVVNRLYEDWLRQGGCHGSRLPARSTFAVKALPKGAKVEIECIAAIQSMGSEISPSSC